MKYRIVLPNDYNSEENSQKLQADFPELEGDDLEIAAFERIRDLWPDLVLLQFVDFGGIYESATEVPTDLPAWAWVSKIEESD